MNKKGFTLVELLGVIILMSVVILVVVTPIVGHIKNTANKLSDASLSVLNESTSDYLEERVSNYPKTDLNKYYISVGQLIDSKSLNENFLESISSKVLTRSSVIIVTVENGNYTFKIAEEVDNIKVLDSVRQNVVSSGTFSHNKGTYYTGASSNNYVYYSGFIWRIMGINKDGSIKLITDEVVTAINYGNFNKYKDSYANEWLNNYFYGHLKYNDYLVNQEECFTPISDINTLEDKCINLITSSKNYLKVSQISLEQYNMSIVSTVSYLNIGLNYSTSTFSPDNLNLYQISSAGTPSSALIDGTHFIRPVISLMKETPVTSGDGTVNNPYILLQSSENVDIEDNRKLNSLNISSGEYISLNNNIYRVVESDKKSTKLILNKLYQISGGNITGQFNSTSTSTFYHNTGIGYMLNNDLYQLEYSVLNDAVQNDFWYQGSNTLSSKNYKNSSLSKTNIIYGVYVGLPKIGELLTAPIYKVNTDKFWTMSMSTAANLYTVSSAGVSSDIATSAAYIRPVISIDSTLIVSNGNGTSLSPYVVNY